jgi:eukaryotic-like serine/threonine-protein kinase
MIGYTLSHYRIIEKIGQGGMGVVYKAQDLHLDRFAAIKVLPQDKLADPERKRHFVREAKAASALNHPNIITIYDIDEAESICFIAMEYVAGRTLQEMIDGEGVTLEQSLEYGIQISEALAKAHQEGIIHRDLKPSNVMVTGANLVKVLDFGLAKLTRRTAFPGNDEEITQSMDTLSGGDSIWGTLPYMSPEQVRGQEQDLRTDIFSLGSMIYKMVAGKTPFQGPHAAAILESLLHSPTPSLRDAIPNIPDALEKAIARATAKDPEDRYPCMQELTVDLRAARGDSSFQSGSRLPFSKRMVLPDKKKRLLRGRNVLVATVVLIFVFLAAMFLRNRQPRWLGGTALPKQIRLAVLPFNNIGDDFRTQAICDGLMEILSTKFNQMRQLQTTLNIVPATEVLTEKVVSPSHARRAFGANLVLTGSVQRIVDKILLTINLVDTRTLRQIDGEVCTAGVADLLFLEEDAFVRASSMLEFKLNPGARQMLHAGEPSVPSAYNAYLLAVGCLVRYDKPENVDKAIQLFRQAIREDPRYALAYAGLGEANWRTYQSTRESRWADEALANCLRAVELNGGLARPHVTLGIVYTGTGRPVQAVNELARALALEPKSADAHKELARAYEALGQAAEAETTYRKAILLNPESWSCYWNLGAFHYRQSNYAQAATQFLEVIRLAPDHYRAYSSLGGVYIYQGKFEDAAKMFRKSLDIKPSPQAYSNLAASLILQGRFPEAVPLLEKAVAMGDASYEVWGNLADAYSQTPESVSKAPAAYRQAADLARSELAVNPNSPARANLAFYLIRSGDRTRALEEVNRVRRQLPNDQNTLFWAALVYELAGNRGDALRALTSAVAGGYSLALIRAASDLKDLRQDPRYRDLVERSSSP